MTGTTRLMAAAVLGVVALCGCKAVEQGTKAISNTTIAGDNSPNANSMACVSERHEVQMAVDSYTLLEDKPPAGEAALVPDYLRTQSKLMDIGPDGKVVAAPGSGCA